MKALFIGVSGEPLLEYQLAKLALYFLLAQLIEKLTGEGNARRQYPNTRRYLIWATAQVGDFATAERRRL